MERSTDTGKIKYVAWLPSQVAKIAKCVKIDSLGDYWWVISEVGSSTRTVEDLDNQRDAHKRFESVLK